LDSFNGSLHQNIHTADHFSSFDRAALSELDRDLVGTPTASGAWQTPRRLKQAHGPERTEEKSLSTRRIE
jgi:hypothetical protein